MSFPTYAHYKDSGVEWLGEVPAHWNVTRLKFVASVQTGMAKGKEYGDKETLVVPYLRVANVQDGYLALDDMATMEIPVAELDRYRLQPGDVLMNEGGDFDKLGRGHVWQGEIEPCIHQNHVFAVRPIGVSPRWLNTYTGSNAAQFYFMTRSKQSTNLASISSTNIMELPLPAPSAQEQELILSFLERETTKLDALITEQRTLIDLLKEKRQAVISHAVTKGLDPRVPMKDSGVEWLGEVPAHWDFFPIKRELQFLTSGSRGWADHYADEGPLFIRIGNLTRDDVGLDLSDIQRVQIPQGSEGERTRVQPGDVLFSITAYIGSVAVVPENLETAYVSQHVALARLNAGKLLPEWVAYFAKSLVGKIFLENQGYGGTKVQLSLDDVANLPVTVPPLDEQHRVVSSIREENARLDALTAEAQTTIALLQERRSALISAAVTGKIDVRGT